MVHDFENQLCVLLKEVFGSAPEDSGCPAEEITAVEAQLGLSLPAVLQCCYRIAGRHLAFRQGMQNLQPLHRLKLTEFETDEGGKDNGLVFLVERQRAYFSVIRRDALSQEDPSVFQGNIHEKKLYPEAPRLSSFLLKALCWNAIQVLPVSGSAEDEPTDLKEFARRMRRVECGAVDENQPQMFQRGHLVVCAFPKKVGARYDLYVAVQKDEELEQFEKEFGVQVSWN